MKRIKENKLAAGAAALLGIPVLTFLVSLFFALIKQMAVMRVLGSLLFIFGFIYLGGHLFYYLAFRANQSKIDTIINTPPIQKCLACKSHLDVEETRITNKIGIPSSEINLECPECFTRLKSAFPYELWSVEEVNAKANPEFAWLYAAETLDKNDLALLNLGKLTPKAVRKVRARELSRISDGYLDALQNLNRPELVLAKDKVTTGFFPNGKEIPWQFKLQKDEIFYIYSTNISYQTQRTKNNVPYLKPEATGSLFISNKRFAFIAPLKSVVKKHSEIADIKQTQHTVIIYVHGRKTPIAFCNLDESLFASVLEGVSRAV